MNSKGLVELLEINHPDHQLPDDGFQLLVDSEYFNKFPMMFLPLASVSTLGFKLFEEPHRDDLELITRYHGIEHLGNLSDDDIIKYRGRGIFNKAMIGRKNYCECSNAIKENLIVHPEILSENWSVMVKVANWQLEELVVKQKIRKMDLFITSLRLNGTTCFSNIRDRSKRSLFTDWTINYLEKRKCSIVEKK